MIIHSYESSKRADACIEYIRRSEKLKSLDKLILLPIPTTRDKKTVLGTEVYICDALDLADASSLVVGYDFPDDVIDLARERDVTVFDVSKDDKSRTEIFAHEFS